MSRILEKGLFITFAVVFILGGVQTAAAIPPMPMSVDGAVTIDGKVAPEGTVVAAFMDGASVDECVISLSGEYMLTIPGEHEDTGKTITFLVNGVDTQHSEKWESGSIVSIDLSITTPARDSDGTGSRSNTGSTSSVSYSEPSIESEGANASDTELEQMISDTEESDNASHDLSPSSPSRSQPGFSLIFAVAGIFSSYMKLNGKRGQDDD